MVVPVIYGGYLVATIAGRVAISVIARYAAKHGIKKAIARFGSKILKNNRVKSAINKLIKQSKTLTKTVVKGGKKFKVKYRAKTPKGKAILTKIAKGKPVKTVKGKPVKTVKGKPVKIAKGKPVKIAKGKPVKTVKGKPVKVAKGKPVKVAKGKPVKIAKGKPTKIAKGKPVKTVKGKPVKIAKGKPTKVAKGKPTKTAKGKPTKTAKGKPVKTVKGKPVKTKPFFTPPKVLGGAAIIGGLGLLISKYGKKGTIPRHPKIKKPKPEIIPKPKPDAPRDKPGPQSGPTVKKKLEPRFLQAPLRTGPQVKTKFTEAREKSFEDRVRALVAQKDRLKGIDAGDGRSEYQVRMHKLKLENKKAWKKLFTFGGKLK